MCNVQLVRDALRDQSAEGDGTLQKSSIPRYLICRGLNTQNRTSDLDFIGPTQGFHLVHWVISYLQQIFSSGPSPRPPESFIETG
jgi:hypothetical protein